MNNINVKNIYKTIILFIPIIALFLLFTSCNSINNALFPHYKVPLNIKITDFDQENSTLIPVDIKGNNETGLPIKAIQFINDKGEGLSLAKGSYILTFPASPLCENGTMYNQPRQEIKADIYNLDEEGTFKDLTKKQHVFNKKNSFWTDETSINEALEIAKLLPAQASKAEIYAAKTKEEAKRAMTGNWVWDEETHSEQERIPYRLKLDRIIEFFKMDKENGSILGWSTNSIKIANLEKDINDLCETIDDVFNHLEEKLESSDYNKLVSEKEHWESNLEDSAKREAEKNGGMDSDEGYIAYLSYKGDKMIPKCQEYINKIIAKRPWP